MSLSHLWSTAPEWVKDTKRAENDFLAGKIDLDTFRATVRQLQGRVWDEPFGFKGTTIGQEWEERFKRYETEPPADQGNIEFSGKTLKQTRNSTDEEGWL